MASNLKKKRSAKASAKTTIKRHSQSTVEAKPAVVKKVVVPTKQARLEARLSEEQKNLIEKAAHAMGQSLTDFVLTSASEAAVRTLKDVSLINISEKHQQAFVKLLMNPPQPNAVLKKNASLYWDASSL